MHHAETLGIYAGLVHLDEQAKLRLESFSMHDNLAVTPQQVCLTSAKIYLGPLQGANGMSHQMACKSFV